MKINNLTASRNYIIAIADAVVAGGKNNPLAVLGGIGMLAVQVLIAITVLLKGHVVLQSLNVGTTWL